MIEMAETASLNAASVRQSSQGEVSPASETSLHTKSTEKLIPNVPSVS